MMPAWACDKLIDRLPPVRGSLSESVPLAGITWFRVGGAAEIMFRPADRDDLVAFLSTKPRDIPVTIIGTGSNLLVRDGGVPGVVIRLGRGFAEVSVEGDRVTAGAGALDSNVAVTCREASKTGLEFLSGIPGTIGGAVRMNAGAYDREMKDVVVAAEALDTAGVLHRLSAQHLGFSYRRCSVPEDWLFVSAEMMVVDGDRETIARRMSEIGASRKGSQPIRSRTGGSTFKNPPGAKAWELIDAAGCRGLTLGGAQVSEVHCNFLVNTGSATAADLEALGDLVRRRVKRHSNIELEWEIRRIGEPLAMGEGPGG